ncbi:MAG: hypothetical protein JWL83_4344 [Actinomycetia bacterium]|nr:hypothetical protein [Actinomycetes bacterium]
MNRRTERRERGQATGLRFRRGRGPALADAAAASGVVAPPIPDPAPITYADVQRAEREQRIAERRERLQAERARLRDEAQREAGTAWDARAYDQRARAEAQARLNTEAIERARRMRIDRGTALAAERRATEQQRLQRMRDAEVRRQREAAERFKRRTTELAARQRLGREAEETMVDTFVIDELHRQRDVELSRAAVVQLRSEEARELARSWVVNPEPSLPTEAPAPIPGEHRAVEALLVELPRVGAPDEFPRAAVAVADPEPAPLPSPVPQPPAGRGREREREKKAVTALDVDALNALLNGKR